MTMEISWIENSNLHIQTKNLNICTTHSKTHGKSRDFSIARIHLFLCKAPPIGWWRDRSTVSAVAKRDEGNKILKTVAHSNKNEQPHTYHRNEAGTRPRTMIAHPHRSTMSSSCRVWKTAMGFPGVVPEHVPGTLGEHGMFPVPCSLFLP